MPCSCPAVLLTITGGERVSIAELLSELAFQLRIQFPEIAGVSMVEESAPPEQRAFGLLRETEKQVWPRLVTAWGAGAGLGRLPYEVARLGFSAQVDGRAPLDPGVV